MKCTWKLSRSSEDTLTLEWFKDGPLISIRTTRKLSSYPLDYTCIDLSWTEVKEIGRYLLRMTAHRNTGRFYGIKDESNPKWNEYCQKEKEIFQELIEEESKGESEPYMTEYYKNHPEKWEEFLKKSDPDGKYPISEFIQARDIFNRVKRAWRNLQRVTHRSQDNS